MKFVLNFDFYNLLLVLRKKISTMEFNGLKNKNSYKYAYKTTREKFEKNESVASLCYAIAAACLLTILLMILQYYGYF